VTHQQKCNALAAELAAARAQGASVALGKSTSNLFRRRHRNGAIRMDVRSFNRVLSVDPERGIADVEGMTTYEDLVEETLRHGLLPTVVPQLKTITIGGAVSGVGIESSSFRYGLVHETVEEMEILLGDGSVTVCSPCRNQDLFYGFPNSYGTLGYVLRLKVKLIPAKRFVRLSHRRFTDPDRYFAQIADFVGGQTPTPAAGLLMDQEADLGVGRGPGGPPHYLDGAVFGRDEMYVTTGEFCDEAPRTSDYTYLRIYYESIRQKKEDWLTAKDYIWRWDTDWFWCSKQFHLQTPALRFLATKWALNSRTYQRVMRAAQRVMPDTGSTESVIQDVDIPIESAAEFLDFLHTEIGILPIWICPFRSYRQDVLYDLYALDPAKVYINFGFWDTVPTSHEDGFFNKKVERKAFDLKGKKGLYSTAYYDRETFWTIYNQERYNALKARYDPGGVFRDLYAKCVERK
jgi:FAD/FMN-containing dehydrogenase